MTSSVVPWSATGKVAGLVAGSYGLADSYHLEHLASTLPEAVAAASEMVSSESGLELPGAPEVAVVSRPDWVERNLASFTKLLEPAERKLAERLERSPAQGWGIQAARTVMAAETGALLGFLSRRVLGQYELVLPTGEAGDAVAFVGPNLLQLERIHQFNPSEFRMWVALHESAHRAQFVGVPWMRDYFLSLVEELIASMEPEITRLQAAVDELVRRRREGMPLVDEAGLIGLFASGAQRETLDRVQALMSLLEGHGHVMMDRLGVRVLRSQPRMSRILKARRSQTRTALLLRMAGMEMKIRQYELGETFVLGVERLSSWETLDRAWESPESLPSLEEIEDPARWVRRVA